MSELLEEELRFLEEFRSDNVQRISPVCFQNIFSFYKSLVSV